MDIKIYKKKTMKEKQEFVRHIKKVSHLKLNQFSEPIKAEKYKNTEYVFYACKFITLDNEKVMPGKHIVMMPNKSLWLQLYEELEKKGMLKKKNVLLTIRKDNNYVYDITIHTE